MKDSIRKGREARVLAVVGPDAAVGKTDGEEAEREASIRTCSERRSSKVAARRGNGCIFPEAVRWT